MIIYGTQAKQVARETLQDKCPNCGTSNSVDLLIFQRYAHVFWIPFFPIGKTAASKCNHCQQVLKGKQMPRSFVMACDNIKPKTRTPIWMFSGLAVLALLVISIVIYDQQHDERNAKLILNPIAGDVFEIKIQDNKYSLLKVEAIEGDSVLVRQHNYVTDKVSGLFDLKQKGDEGYGANVYSIHKNSLKELLDQGFILDIDRE